VTEQEHGKNLDDRKLVSWLQALQHLGRGVGYCTPSDLGEQLLELIDTIRIGSKPLKVFRPSVELKALRQRQLVWRAQVVRLAVDPDG
jgi:hypothetical protein